MIESTAQQEVMQSDRELLEEFLDGQAEAFDRLVQRHGRMILGVALRVTGDYHEAEDVCQAVFLVLARKARKVRRCRSLAAWLHHVTRQMALDARKSSHRRTARHVRIAKEDGDEPAQGCPQASVELIELRDVMDEELDQLPRHYRQAVLLHHVEGLTQSQAADLMGCSAGTLSWWLSRARGVLRKRLSRRGVAATGSLLVAGLTSAQASASAVCSLAPATTRAAVATLSGGMAGASALLNPSTLALAKGALNGMFAANVKVGASAMLAVAVATVGISLAGVDHWGDPLPEGAISRLGTERFQHPGRIEAMDWSPDGKYIATAARFGNSVYVWDAQTGKPIWHEGFGNMARSVRFSGNGKYLAGCGTDGTARVWEVGTWKRVQMIKGMPRATRVAISHDGKTLACAYGGGDGKFARIYDMETGELKKVLKDPHPDAGKDNNFYPYGVALSPDGKLAGTVAVRASHLWDLETGEPIATFGGQQKGKMDFSPDGKWFAFTTRGLCAMQFVDVAKRELVTKRPPLMGQYGPQPFHCIRFSPDSKYLAAGNLGGKAAVWKVEDLLKIDSEPVRIHAGSAYLGGVAFSPKSDKLVTGSWDGSLRFWNPETGKEVGGLLPSRSPIESIVWSADGKMIATGHQGGTVSLWDRAGAPLNQLEGERSVSAVTFSDNSAILAAARQGGMVEAWNLALESDPVRAELGPLTQRLSYFGATKELLAVDSVEFARLVDPVSGKVRRIQPMPVDVSQEYNAHGLSVSPDQTLAAARLISREDREAARGHGGKSIKESIPITVWELATGSVVAKVTVAESTFRTSLSPDGRLLAVNGLSGKKTQLIDLKTGKIVHNLRTGFCDELLFSPSGRMFVALGETVTLWDVTTGRKLKTYENNKGRGQAAAFDAVESALAIADETNAALVWDISEIQVSQPETSGEPLEPATFAEYVSALSAENAADAHQAIWALAARPDSTLEQLTAEHLRPFAIGSEAELEAAREEISQLVLDLTAGSYKDRQSAYERLEAMTASAPQVRAMLREKAQQLANNENPAASQKGQSLLASLERPLPVSTQALRVFRTAKLLEAIGTAEAAEKLTTLAGESGAWVNGFARCARKRIQARLGQVRQASAR